ncbi:Malectin-like domain [Dillenia turbinata]|uniref:Malectin-like domain n=1 Tax=Dillenia turbinata TaxID=194707 RepID=A0AAN8ZAX2_9MAGN
MAITNLVAFLLLFLRAFSAEVHLNIDCGTSKSYNDVTDIKWVGDGAYVQSGESQTAKNSQRSNGLSTLRVFKSKTKNCYSIPGFQETKVLLRAIFYYGNYDSSDSPPSFDLLLDENKWTTVHTTNDDWNNYDIIYVPKRQNISVCLAQINPNQFPFISMLEVWSLDSNMYNQIDSSQALMLNQRYAFGSSDRISYPTDPYNRYWNAFSGNGLVSVSNSASSVDVTQTKDQVPSAVMSNAVRTSSTSTDFLVSTAALPPTHEVPIYLNMYFTEVQDLNPSSDLRRFNVMVDKKVIDVINPAYQTAVETTYANIIASSKTQIVLAATSDSTLPPLVSGLELFIITDQLSNSTTNITDVEGLASLQEGFPALKEWSGDPCLPAEYPWDWVNCTNETTPRITSLLLSGYNLNGLLPNFSSLDALQTIDLHNNSITGNIPDFLASFPNLTLIDVRDNNFTGYIPKWISEKANLEFRSSGNPYLCNIACPKPPSKHRVKKWLIGVLSSVIPTLVGAVVIAAVRYWCKCCKSRKEKAKPSDRALESTDSTALKTPRQEVLPLKQTAQKVVEGVICVTLEQVTN